jgi:F-type H+-transporting ATPase subunit b
MRFRAGIGTLSAAVWLTANGVAQASEAGGSPDPVRVDLWQAGFTIVVFAVLVVVLGKFAFKPILHSLQQRENFIRDSLESAKNDREAAEARLAEYEERLRSARDEAAGMVEEGRRDAEAVRRRLEEEARQSAEAIADRAKRDIGIARDTALKDLHEESARLAIRLAAEVLKRQLSPEDHERLVNDALAQLRERGTAGPN